MCNLVVRKRKMLKDERGQMSIDFLAGLSLFMLTLLFLVHFIPGMFVPFQSETIDLSSVSYRTSVILVEDPGWWDNGTIPAEDWENHNDSVRRVGLAIDKEHPNMLNMSKIDVFENETLINDTVLIESLGLYRNISGNVIYYGYNITLRGLNGTIMAARGETSPEYGDVSSMKRLVRTEVGEIAIADGNLSSPVPASRIANINYTHTEDKDFRIVLTGFNMSSAPAKLLWVKISGGGNLKGSDGLTIILNGTTMVSPTVNENDPNPQIEFWNSDDKFDITIAKDNLQVPFVIPNNYTIEIKFNVHVILTPGEIIYANLTKIPEFKDQMLVVKVWT